MIFSCLWKMLLCHLAFTVAFMLFFWALSRVLLTGKMWRSYDVKRNERIAIYCVVGYSKVNRNWFIETTNQKVVGSNIRNLNLRTARLERFALLVSQGIARAPRAEFPPRAPHTAGLAQVAFVFDKCPTGAPLPSLPAGLTKANQPPFTGD